MGGVSEGFGGAVTLSFGGMLVLGVGSAGISMHWVVLTRRVLSTYGFL